MRALIESEFALTADVVSKINPEEVEVISRVVADAIRNGHQIHFMGNGGSSCDAQHLAAELSGKYLFDRPAMPGVCYSNVAPITAIGNDYTYDNVFMRQVEAFARPGDVVIGLSTSGNSKNVVLAMERAKEIGAITVSFTGDSGVMKEIADYPLIIKSRETPHIQEGYFVAGHMMCCLVELLMFGKKAVFIDRDDTIAKDVPYCSNPDDFVLFDGVPEAIAKLNSAGYLVIVITNQSGIYRGKFDVDTLDAIHDKMLNEVAAGGGKIDDIFYCPHSPEGGCGCRKPEPGMGIMAIKKHHIDVTKSYMIGNSDSDVKFGDAIGCSTLKVDEKFTFVDAVDEILAKE